MLLLSDADLGAFHEPPVCNASDDGRSSQRDCFDPGCSAAVCKYSVSLIQVRGDGPLLSLTMSCAIDVSVQADCAWHKQSQKNTRTTSVLVCVLVSVV